MKTVTFTRATVIVAGMFFAGCASSSSPVASPEPETPSAAAPLPGENFVVLYTDAMGMRKRDTRTGSDVVIVPRSPSVAYGDASFGIGLAVFARHSNDSTWLHIAMEESEAPRTVHSGPAGTYSFVWSADRAQLAFGYQPADVGASGVWVVSADGTVRSVGCRAANRVHAWRSTGQLLVGDSRNVYTVNARTCATLATLPRQGKQDFAFAAGGGKLSFTRGGELYIANHDGSGAQKIADRAVGARSAAWAPDASKVAFVIDSPRFANRTHVAVHDVATGRVSYNDQETPLGVPNESNPCWSPDGRRVLFDRVFDRSDGVQTYQMKQKVVTLDNTETIVFEELVRDERRPASEGCTWVDETHILISTNSGFRVINVDDRTEYEIEDAEAVLMVRVHD